MNKGKREKKTKQKKKEERKIEKGEIKMKGNSKEKEGGGGSDIPFHFLARLSIFDFCLLFSQRAIVLKGERR